MQAIRDLDGARRPSEEHCRRVQSLARNRWPDWYVTTVASALGCPRAALALMRVGAPFSNTGMCTAAVSGFEDVVCAASGLTFCDPSLLLGLEVSGEVSFIRHVPAAEYQAAVAACLRWAPRSTRRVWITAFASGGGVVG